MDNWTNLDTMDGQLSQYIPKSQMTSYNTKHTKVTYFPKQSSFKVLNMASVMASLRCQATGLN